MIIDQQAEFGKMIWRADSETIRTAQLTEFRQYVQKQGVDIGDAYEELWQWSVNEPAAFWQAFAEFAGVHMKPASGPIHTTDPMPNTKWFPGRHLNFARQLLEGHEGTALLAVAEDGQQTEVSWQQLRHEVAALAQHLRAMGVEQGDRVAAVLPNIAEAVTAFLATASIGAVWSICSPEFGPGAIASRFTQLEPKVLITSPGHTLGGKDRDNTATIQAVLDEVSSIEHVVWVAGETAITEPALEVSTACWDEIILQDAPLDFTDVEFNTPLWVLFSSGTTGKPKGIVHSHGGALLEELKMLMFHTELRPGDRYLNVASTSWVLWNALVSALGVGATAVLVDGNPTYPSHSRVWEVAAATKTTALGVSAGLIHACEKTGVEASKDYDLSNLKCLQVTGSPLSLDGYRWVYSNVGDVWLSSMSGGTDIVSIFVGGVITEPVYAGHIQVPALGVGVESWDNTGKPTTGKGELVVTDPMPSMPLFFWGDADGSRYRDSYFTMFPGVWRHGDFIEFNESGILIHGRSDSTLNRHGLRLGSAEIYGVVEAIPEVAEAMVIGAEIGAEDYYMPLFIQPAAGFDAEQTRADIVAAIRKHLSPRYLPDDIIEMRAIPHTKTGKKLEVPVKRLLQGEAAHDVVDLGAIDDAELFAQYATFARDYLEQRTRAAV